MSTYDDMQAACYLRVQAADLAVKLYVGMADPRRPLPPRSKIIETCDVFLAWLLDDRALLRELGIHFNLVAADDEAKSKQERRDSFDPVAAGYTELAWVTFSDETKDGIIDVFESKDPGKPE